MKTLLMMKKWAILSRRYWMTSAQFIHWINRQTCKADIWVRVREQVNDFNRMNRRPIQTDDSILSYLLSPGGMDTFDADAENILRAAQLAGREVNQRLRMEPGDEKYFKRSDPDDEERKRLEGDPSGLAAFIPDEDQLMFIKPVSAQEYIDLVNAQKCRDEAWKRITKELTGLLSKPDLSSTDVRKRITRMSAQELKMWSRMMMKPLQSACKVSGEPLQIPTALSGRIGTLFDGLRPEDKESYIARKERLHFAPCPTGWRFYCFQPVDPGGVNFPALDPEEVREDYLASLQEIGSFAKRVGSPFSEAFGLARFLIEDISTSLSQIDSVLLGHNGFSSTAQESLFAGKFYDSLVRDLRLE